MSLHSVDDSGKAIQSNQKDEMCLKSKKLKFGNLKPAKQRCYKHLTCLLTEDQPFKGKKKRMKMNRRETKPKLFAEAPANDNEFLMNEHDNFSDGILTEDKPTGQYSISPDSEEGFLAKEFWSAYEDDNMDQVDKMTKSQLIQECLSLQTIVDKLEVELFDAADQNNPSFHGCFPHGDEASVPREFPVDAETAAKIEIFNKEISRLLKTNESIRKENNEMREKIQRHRLASSDSDSQNTQFISIPFNCEDDACIAKGDTNPGVYNDDSNVDSGVASVDGCTSTSSLEDLPFRANNPI